MSKDLNRQKQLFEAALEQDPSVRADWLRRACGDDEELFVTVWELLESHAAAGSFLATPEAMVQRQLGLPATPPPAPNTEQPGQWVGGYKLLEPLGEGGFGIVWMAQQEQPVRRLVALKVLKAGMDSAQVVARFEQERQALAVMQHPHIAQVFDAGVSSAGRPFFVMELVKGVPINDYCARERLSVPARLQLFVQVCRAVQHAHGKGVIHRDIKPRNVLVATHDGKPLAKVIDFGIAKATGARLTERTLFTEHRAMVGTLEYMSPEQAEGLLDIDTRADVYSLGALLYELLTGGTPFESRKLLDAGMAELLRVLREDEPQRPSLRVSNKAAAGWAGGAGRAIAAVDEKALFGALRGDLDWVVMKALEKDRGRRYASADGLAEDVERYLAGDAVLAVPPSVGYRVRKLVRRHRAAVLSTATVASLVLVGGGLLLRAWGQQEAEQRRAALAREEERFASYGNAVRAGVENADLGNRALGLAGLDACEVGLRDWEWRHARARAEDTVRFRRNDVVAWGANVDGSTVAVIDQVVEPRERPVREGVIEREFLGRDRITLLEVGSLDARTVWQSEPTAGPALRQSSFANHRVVVDREMHLIGVEPEGSTLLAHASLKSGRVVGLLDWSSSVMLQQPMPEGHHACLDLRQGHYIACDSSGRIECRELRSGQPIWIHPQAILGVSDISMDSARGMLAVACTEDGGKLKMFRASTGTMLWEVGTRFDAAVDGERAFIVPDTDLMRLVPDDAWRLIALVRGDQAYVIDTESRESYSADFGDFSRYLDMHPKDWSLFSVDAITEGNRRLSKIFESYKTFRTQLRRTRWRDPMAMMMTERRQSESAKHEAATTLVVGVWLQDGVDIGSHTSLRDKETINGVSFNNITYYRGGLSDFSVATREWRTEPRRFPGAHRRPVGSSGLCSIQLGHLLLILADRPNDVFPPRPMGLRCGVTTLGFWGALPAAVYPGGVTTLDCDESVRLPTDDSPFPIDAASSDRSGSLLAIASNTNLRVIATADGRDARPAIPIHGKVRALALAPEGRHVVAILEGDDKALALHVFAADSYASVASRPLPSPHAAEPAFALSATSDRLALADGHAPLRLFALPSLDELRCDPAAAHPATSVQFSPDGDRLAVGRLDGRVDILRRDGTVGPRFAAHSEAVSAFAWTQNGTRLFTAGRDGFVRIWEPTKGVELLNLGDNSNPGQPGMRAFDGLPNCLFATPDGERLFCGYTDGAVRVWDTVPWLERVARRKAREASAPQQPK